ncbi:MAG: polysaccharide biosynthesis/export family protein [Deltaproteobacteria bacterium]
MKTLWAVACAALAAAIITASPVLAAESGESETAKAAPAPLSTKQPAPLPPSQAGPEYRLGPEDLLHVSVWENKELTRDVMVRPDGKISLPLVQDVQAEGLTASELSNIIHQKLKDFIVEPQVSVIVTQVNAPKVFVIGNVVKPGPFPLRSDMSLLQALSLAGGFTQFASPRSIRLIRGTGAKQESRKVNYYNMLDDGGGGNYLLKPGDTIVVP